MQTLEVLAVLKDGGVHTVSTFKWGGGGGLQHVLPCLGGGAHFSNFVVPPSS